MKKTIVTATALCMFVGSAALAEGTYRRGTTSTETPHTQGTAHQGTDSQSTLNQERSQAQGRMNQNNDRGSMDRPMTNRSDTELTRMVREKIMADTTLSARAKNITIVTNGGRVTLRGNVSTSQEKSKVESIAKQTSGATAVENLTVVTK